MSSRSEGADGLDPIADPGVYEAGGIPHEAFARLRADDPVHWTPWHNSRGGFWSVTRHPDVYAVSRDAATFCNGEFTNLFELSEEAKTARRSIIDSDAPLHTRLRRLVLPPFTTRKVPDYDAATRAITGRLLDTAVAAGPTNLVAALTEPLPIQVFVNILGVPPEDADYMVELSNQLVEGTAHREPVDPGAYGNTTPLELLPFNSPASWALFEYGRQLGERRRTEPADDLVTTLVQAEVDGDRLSDAEFCNFFQLLVFAGNETTRTALSHGLLAFMQHPDQLERLHADPSLIPGAVEEIIRWATPVLHMRRTATTDTVLHGTPIAAGEWVVLWYASSNFDGSVLADPLRFDVGRPVNPNHQAFGGYGPHHCLGAHLARLEIKVVLEEIVARGLRVEPTGDPVVRVPSNFVHGIVALPGQLVPA